MGNIDRVKTIIKCIEGNDKASILACFHHEAVFHNIPMEPAKGYEAIWQVFEAIHKDAEEIRWDIHHIAETGEGLVLTERTDCYKLKGKWCKFEVMGIFELDQESGKILHWRDYFDLAKCVQGMQ